MILRDGGKIISDAEKVVDIFSKFSVNMENILNIDKDKRVIVETKDAFDPVF